MKANTMQNIYQASNPEFFGKLKDIIVKNPTSYATIVKSKHNMHLVEWIDSCVP